MVIKREGKSVRIYLPPDLIDRLNALIRSGRFPAFEQRLNKHEQKLKENRNKGRIRTDLSLYSSFISCLVDAIGNNFIAIQNTQTGASTAESILNESPGLALVVSNQSAVDYLEPQITVDTLDLLGDI